MDELADRSLHMWSHIVPSTKNQATSHGACGVHIGRFTSAPKEVTCVGCLAIINAKEDDEPA